MKIRNLKRILAWLMCLCMVLSCALYGEGYEAGLPKKADATFPPS